MSVWEALTKKIPGAVMKKRIEARQRDVDCIEKNSNILQ